jgi:predicted RNase H-like nuclease (RuvC/YqgF family)
VPIKNYRRTLAEAKRDLARLLAERQKIDHKLARLQGVINNLETFCDELNQKVSGERMTKEELRMGFTTLALTCPPSLVQG